MDKRIFVEKKADFQVKSESLVRELQHNLGTVKFEKYSHRASV